MTRIAGADEKTAIMVNYLSWNWHNRWSLLQRLTTEGELDIVLSPMALSWLSDLEYERIEALEEETEWGRTKPVRWKCDVSHRIGEANVTVTNLCL